MAGRYATALFDLARETNAIEAVTADLDRFDALVAASPDLTRLVRSPVFSAEEQLQALSAVLDRAGIGGLAANFFKLAASHRRVVAGGAIFKAFRPLGAPHESGSTPRAAH